MLIRIKISQLFNVYNYDIDLTNADGTAVKFITAPNGYGKTTILDFIEAAMRQTYDKLFQTPFKSFELFFNEAGSEAVYRYSIIRIDEESKAIDSDIVQTLSKTLQIHLNCISGSDEALIEEFTVLQTTDGALTMSVNTDNINLIFDSRTCYYLNDQRMLSMKMDSKDEVLSIDDNKRAIERMRPYPGELKDILSSPEKNKEYESRIACFRAIINRCEFAGKHLEIDKRFGFRFMTEDELHTILSLDQLSSGEKQMIIQVFELLFHAKSGTLVMIDEPELSLHMMWQMNYLKNLSEIAQLRGFQCIVATHSPQIFNSMWSKSVDLFTLSSQA